MLLSDEKQCAEHIMLVDLGRNDVGNVTKPGSANVEKLMTVERYFHVMHISSTVRHYYFVCCFIFFSINNNNLLIILNRYGSLLVLKGDTG
ncbi:putative anthranilate synthase [Helianthus annuus]|nr:putative anthranilate synthase [Helianthus annuus]